jgi:transcriptional regulator with PAS, ATPase and Fis domain
MNWSVLVSRFVARQTGSTRDELNARSGYHRVIGESASWRQVLTQAAQVGATESTVLLLGESGNGKAVVARFIHRTSARARGPFAAVNCAREDLFYRLNVFPIRLPPLRERRDDILALSEAFLADLGRTLGRPPGGLSEDAKRALLDDHWPGNVRELPAICSSAPPSCPKAG